MNWSPHDALRPGIIKTQGNAAQNRQEGDHVTPGRHGSPHIRTGSISAGIEIIEDRIRGHGHGLIALDRPSHPQREYLDGQGNVTGYTVHLGDGSRVLETEMLILNIGNQGMHRIIGPRRDCHWTGIVVMSACIPAPRYFAAGDRCQGNNMQSGAAFHHRAVGQTRVQASAAGRTWPVRADETATSRTPTSNLFWDYDFIGLGDNRLTGDTYTYTSRNKGFTCRPSSGTETGGI